MAEPERGPDFPELHSRALLIETTAPAWLLFGWTHLSHRAANLGKGWSNTPPSILLNFCLFQLEKQRPESGVRAGSGECDSIPLKILVLLVGILFSISLPSWCCGAELSQGVDCAERRRKKGRFHLAWIYPESDFLPEILIWNRFFPFPYSSLQSLTTQAWTVNLFTPKGLAKCLAKGWVGVLALNIKLIAATAVPQRCAGHCTLPWKSQNSCKNQLGRI